VLSFGAGCRHSFKGELDRNTKITSEDLDKFGSIMVIHGDDEPDQEAEEWCENISREDRNVRYCSTSEIFGSEANCTVLLCPVEEIPERITRAINKLIIVGGDPDGSLAKAVKHADPTFRCSSDPHCGYVGTQLLRHAQFGVEEIRRVKRELDKPDCQLSRARMELSTG